MEGGCEVPPRTKSHQVPCAATSFAFSCGNQKHIVSLFAVVKKMALAITQASPRVTTGFWHSKEPLGTRPTRRASDCGSMDVQTHVEPHTVEHVITLLVCWSWFPFLRLRHDARSTRTAARAGDAWSSEHCSASSRWRFGPMFLVLENVATPYIPVAVQGHSV